MSGYDCKNKTNVLTVAGKSIVNCQQWGQ